MKLTQILYQQHIGRMIRKHWYVQTRVRPMDLRSHIPLREMGIPVEDAMEVAFPKKKQPWFEIKKENIPYPVFEEDIPQHKKICYFYKDESLFIEGLNQAKVLLKTVCVEDKLPDKIENLIKDVPENVENKIKSIIRTSTMFDSEQEKLPKRTHPEKLMWNYARDYGITHKRRTHNLCFKLLSLCELISGVNVSRNRSILFNGVTSILFEKESDLVQLNGNNDIMLMFNKPLLKICEKGTHCDKTLPDIYPSHPLIGVTETNKYKTEDLYPVQSSYDKHHLHTIFVYYDKTTTKNITERPVKEDQYFARALAKSFASAASYARQKFGANVKDLPEPVTVQCVHCDRQEFHFSVFQLNTLNLDGTNGLKNYWWSTPNINLFEKSDYTLGRPLLEGYNPEVFQKLYAFYNNS